MRLIRAGLIFCLVRLIAARLFPVAEVLVLSAEADERVDRTDYSPGLTVLPGQQSPHQPIHTEKI
jgi:hypothetical protein